ncbi:MAG: DNA-binding protein [Hyphomicrobium sp.]|nr:DNA-binding protein [Hyphomicrobium sp.]PPD09048.1 MAG: DNA-binding protein [Hyphomicrobium sp.]
MFTEIAVVVVLIVLNGLLAMSELAVVSSRPARLQVMRDQGSSGAGTAMRLAEDPGRFLSTVQIGITLVGVLSGAFSGATLGARLADWLETQGLSDAAADTVGVMLVVVAITYLSLIVGELVPKQIALRDPERVAARVAPAMAILSRLSAPVVWVLDTSGKLILRLLGQHGESEQRVTEEEVKTIIAEAESAGVLEAEEKEMIAGVMRLADRTATGLMTPRRDVEILNLADQPLNILAKLRATKRSRLPVQDGDADEIVGVVTVKDLYDRLAAQEAAGELQDIRAVADIQVAPVVSDNTRALDVLKAIRSSTVHMALVFDEYGHFEGIITSSDVLEAITGAFQEEGEDEPAFVVRHDGSFLVAGWMPVDEFAERIAMPLDPEADYETVAGLVLDVLHRLPDVGESFEHNSWRFEVVDLDGRRIDKILVSRAA